MCAPVRRPTRLLACILILLLTPHVLAAAEVAAAAAATRPALRRVAASADKRTLVLQPGGERFTPWGFNYDRDYRMRLIEDYWVDEWDTVASDFREMKAL